MDFTNIETKYSDIYCFMIKYSHFCKDKKYLLWFCIDYNALYINHKLIFIYFQALNKKEHKGCDSPDPECDPYMTPMTFEEKYNRMNEDYQRVLQQQNQMRVRLYLLSLLYYPTTVSF